MCLLEQNDDTEYKKLVTEYQTKAAQYQKEAENLYIGEELFIWQSIFKSI